MSSASRSTESQGWGGIVSRFAVSMLALVVGFGLNEVNGCRQKELEAIRTLSKHNAESVSALRIGQAELRTELRLTRATLDDWLKFERSRAIREAPPGRRRDED